MKLSTRIASRTDPHPGLLERWRQRWVGQDRATDDVLPVNPFRRRALLIYAVLLLSVPSAMGVQRALAPTRGWAAATLAAIGFELLYLSTSLLLLNGTLQSFARRVALAAVGTAIVLNVLADYTTRVPGGLARWAEAQARFDPLALALSLLESAPLAGLAYAGALLLHRLSEADVRLGDVAARLRAEVAQLAEQAAQQEGLLAQARAELAQLHAAAEAQEELVAHERAALCSQRDNAAQERERLAVERAEAERERGVFAERLAAQEEMIAQLRADVAQQEAELAQLRAAPPQGELDLPALAHALRRAEPAPWREIEVLLGRPQSTVRGWLAQRNGVAHDA